MTADSDLMRAEGLEKMARAICEAHGYDPDEYAERHVMCTADNQRVPHWMVYKEEATAALAAWEEHCTEMQKAPE